MELWYWRKSSFFCCLLVLHSTNTRSMCAPPYYANILYFLCRTGEARIAGESGSDVVYCILMLCFVFCCCVLCSAVVYCVLLLCIVFCRCLLCSAVYCVLLLFIAFCCCILCSAVVYCVLLLFILF